MRDQHSRALSKWGRAKEMFEQIKGAPRLSRPTVIYQAQEISELAFKAMLDDKGINYEPIHDMQELIQKYQVFPPEIQNTLNSLSGDLGRLSDQRTKAKYDHVNVPPRREPEYSESDAQKAREIAQKLIDLGQRFFK